MKKYYLLILLCIICSFAQAATAIEQLTDILSKTQTIKANFTQTVFTEDSRILQSSAGRLAIARPKQFYWQTEQPNKQIVILNQDIVWIYDVDLEQVTKKHNETNLMNTPASLLSDNLADISQAFRVSMQTNQQGRRYFRLVPRSETATYQQIELMFSEAGRLEKMRFTDNLGQKTKIVLSAVKVNSSLSLSLFELKPPKYVDLIDETKAR